MLYHVTTVSALASIMENGLLPQIGPRSSDLGEDKPAIYAFASLEAVEDALCGWMGESLPGDAEIAVIEIDLDIHPEPDSFEVVLTETVPPALFRRILNESLQDTDPSLASASIIT